MRMEFGIGVSNNWDPEKAAEEALNKALQMIKTKPKFILVFSTIHYAKKPKGLQTLLTFCRRNLEDIPCIGGTVVGFISPEAVHTRGVVVILGTGDDFYVKAFYSPLSRLSPQTKGRELAEKIRNELKSKEYTNKLLLLVLPGASEPSIINNRRANQFYNVVCKFMPRKIQWYTRDIITSTASKIFNTGPGGEEETLSSMQGILPDYYFYGLSTFDNIKGKEHYQFYNGNILRGSTVALAFLTNKKLSLRQDTPVVPISDKFPIKKGWNDYFVDQIKSQDATQKFLEIRKWPGEYVRDARIDKISKTSYYFPLSYTINDKTHIFPAGMFFGNSFFSNFKIKSNEIQFCITSLKKILDSFRSHIESVKNPSFLMIVTGFHVIGIAGDKLNLIKRDLDTSLGNKPYCVLFDVGEHIKMPQEDFFTSDYSLNLLAFTNEQ